MGPPLSLPSVSELREAPPATVSVITFITAILIIVKLHTAENAADSPQRF